jgi:Fe-S-cluster containining protein
MIRDWDLYEVSDGKRYTLSDMVKADCDDCKGCSACCHDMGKSIVLDPLDIYRLSMSFEELLGSTVELNMVDGVILPNLKMSEENNSCIFLDENGRCSIHENRPGICRIFPLGRVYDDGSFNYILQVNECPKENKSKVKVSKWIDTPNLKTNQKFISDWHYFIKKTGQKILNMDDEAVAKKVNLEILQAFYVEPYKKDEDFYTQFYKRLHDTHKILGKVLCDE